MYDPTAGQILLDGVDLREYDVEDLRREIGVIFQDYMRYELVVKEIIGFGKLNTWIATSLSKKRARKSLAAGVISRLPHGFDQMIAGASKAAWISPAASGRKSPSPEPTCATASCSSWTSPPQPWMRAAEYEVFLRFADVTKDRMSVLISHRFSTVRMANRIFGVGRRRNSRAGQPQPTRGSGRTLCGVIRVAGSRLPLNHSPGSQSEIGSTTSPSGARQANPSVNSRPTMYLVPAR